MGIFRVGLAVLLVVCAMQLADARALTKRDVNDLRELQAALRVGRIMDLYIYGIQPLIILR